jgi:hypothetical protein
MKIIINSNYRQECNTILTSSRDEIVPGIGDEVVWAANGGKLRGTVIGRRIDYTYSRSTGLTIPTEVTLSMKSTEPVFNVG